MIQQEIYQGTTVRIPLKFNLENIKSLRACFSQNDTAVFCKTKEDCYSDESGNYLQLNQDDTYMLDEEKGLITLEIRTLDNQNEVTLQEKNIIKIFNLADKVVLI